MTVKKVLTLQAAQKWQQEGAHLNRHEFSASLNLPHDLVNMNKPRSNIRMVDQELLELPTRQQRQN